MNWLKILLHPVAHAAIAAATYVADHAYAITGVVPPKWLPVATGVFGFLAILGFHVRTSDPSSGQ